MRYKDELRIAGVTALFCCAMLMITAVVPKDTTVAKARKTFKEAPETAADAEADCRVARQTQSASSGRPGHTRRPRHIREPDL